MPQQMFEGERVCTKYPHEMLDDVRYIEEMSLYYLLNDGYGDREEIGMVYRDKQGDVHRCLLGFEGDEEWFAPSIVKEKVSTLPKVDCKGITMPTESFSIAQYKEVLAFALKAHVEQKTPNGLPYAFHIVSVAQEIIASLSSYPLGYDEANVAIACALLHDVLEDTDAIIGVKSIDVPQMPIILQGVSALTKDTTLPSKEDQMRDSLERLKRQPKCVQAVKLADRITNLAPAPIYWNKAKRESYRKEAQTIYDALKEANPYLADKLLRKIEAYQVDGDDNYLIFYGSVDEKVKLILDKSASDYLQIFKALDGLNRYVLERYGIKLFQNDFTEENYANFSSVDGLETYRKVDLSYVVRKLNEERLLDINLQTDGNIAAYMEQIFQGEGGMV